jgi:hypothetical protein
MRNSNHALGSVQGLAPINDNEASGSVKLTR